MNTSNMNFLISRIFLVLYNQVLLSVVLCPVSAFAPIIAPQRVMVPFALFYNHRKDWDSDMAGASSSSSSSSDISYGNELNQQRAKPRGLTIPVLPAIPNAMPLMMGSELELDPPTLGQWQALEESLVLHQHYLQGANLTAIDAAPVVAVMDDFTASVQTPGKQRYATIAAVVGISSSKKVPDEKDFMEIMLGCKGTLQPLKSKIRLVGVGRAMLTDFFYQMPTALEIEEECSIEDMLDEDEDDLSPSITDAMDREDPVVMAEFTVLRDNYQSSLYSIARLGEKGARSPNMAPVFAIHEMSRFSNKVTRLHDDRRRLVNMIASAKMRLAEHNVFDDADGIGSIAGVDILDETDRLLNCDNYGLNYYSSFSSIPDLTGVAQDVLENYYSPTRRSTEEYRLEVLSFVAFRSLQGYCSNDDLAWALQCTNSIERLNRAHELMSDHFWNLKQIAKQANHDLCALGEEGCLLDDMYFKEW